MASEKDNLMLTRSSSNAFKQYTQRSNGFLEDQFPEKHPEFVAGDRKHNKKRTRDVVFREAMILAKNMVDVQIRNTKKN